MVAPLVLDIEWREVRFSDGRSERLSPTSMNILRALLEARGKPVSFAALAESCGWGEGWEYEEVSGALKVYVSRLRKAIGRDAIKTVTNFGYGLDPKMFPACPTCGRAR